MKTDKSRTIRRSERFERDREREGDQLFRTMHVAQKETDMTMEQTRTQYSIAIERDEKDSKTKCLLNAFRDRFDYTIDHEFYDRYTHPLVISPSSEPMQSNNQI